MTALDSRAKPEYTVLAAIGQTMGQGGSPIVLAAGRGIQDTEARAQAVNVERFAGNCLFSITAPAGVPEELLPQFVDRVMDLYQDEITHGYRTQIVHVGGQEDWLLPEHSGRRYTVVPIGDDVPDGSHAFNEWTEQCLDRLQQIDLEYTPHFAGETEKHL